MILADVRRLEALNGRPRVLDIGCGGGFDNDKNLQRSLAEHSLEYIGVEPDASIRLGDYFSSKYQCTFEQAPISADSIDIAFSVMVFEHFENPQLVWDKIHGILKKGGVFWAFTVDSRHWFVHASIMMDMLHLKDFYLNKLHGRRGDGRYENYKVFYRSNRPEQIEKMTHAFSSRLILNFYRVGQTNYYFPKKLRFVAKAYDRMAIRMGMPGSILAVRVEK
jgi:SAM-dependent methyltransferase